MQRIKIDLPNKFIFSTEIPLRISDINYGGHLGNDSVLSILQEARIRFLSKYNFSEKNVDGFGIIMVDAAVQYKSQGFYGDVLIIELGLDNFSRIGWDFIYRVTNKETTKEIVRAKTGIAFIDYQNNQLVSVPQKFNELIDKLTSQISNR